MNLAERIEYLEEENRQLRDALRCTEAARFPVKWRLTPAEKRVLTSFISAPAGFRSRDAILRAARRHESTEGDGHLIEVIIYRLRDKLRDYGVRIHTVRGEGYKLDPESKAIVTGARVREVTA